MTYLYWSLLGLAGGGAAVPTKCWEFYMANDGSLTWVEVPCVPCLAVDESEESCVGAAPSGPAGVC